MGRDLDIVKSRLVYSQMFILGMIILGFVALLTFLSIQRGKQVWKSNLETTALHLGDQLKVQMDKNQEKTKEKTESLLTIEGNLTPEEYMMLTGESQSTANNLLAAGLEGFYVSVAQWVVSQNNYRLFVLDKNGDILLYPQKDGGELDLWQQHQSKIIYEVNKQKQGWLEYPYLTKRDWDKDNHLIRYIHIDGLEWTLALEGKQLGLKSHLISTFDRTSLFYLVIAFLIGFILLRFVTYGLFKQTERILSRVWEKKFVNLNTKALKKQDKQWAQVKSQIQMPKPSPLDIQAQVKIEDTKNKTADEIQEEKLVEVTHALGQTSQVKEDELEEDSMEEQELIGVKLPLLRKILSEMKNV